MYSNCCIYHENGVQAWGQEKMVICGGSKCCYYFIYFNMLRSTGVIYDSDWFKIHIVHYFKAVRSCSLRGGQNAPNPGNDPALS